VAWHPDIDGLDQRESGNQRQRLRRWVVAPQLDERAAVEIALDRNPGPTLAAPAGFLVQRDQPVAFDDTLVGDQVGIGRAGALDDTDTRQKSDPAALSV
jgi:hypothetical protein